MSELLNQVATALEGRYEIKEELGSGGMATVFLAHDLQYEREVAVKVLKPSLSEAMGEKRFLREVQITANLNHPGILPMLDSGVAQGVMYYVMPYVEGGSLRGLLEREAQLEIDEAVRITCELAAALDVAHEHNVVHRDIKPENVLMHDGRPVLADFGIATLVDTTDSSVTTAKDLVMGTVAYMSPERCTGESRGERRSDVYALGCVAYEMLSGERPFTARTTTGLVARIVAEPPRSIRIVRPAISKQVEKVVLRSLAKVPADRQRTAGKFADDFTRAAGERVIHPATRVLTAAIVILLALLGIKTIVDSLSHEESAEWFPRTEIAVRFSATDSTESSAWFASALTRGVTRALSIGGAPSVRSGNALASFPSEHSNRSVAQVLEIGTIVDGHVTTRDSTVILDVALVSTRTSRLLGDVSRDSVRVGEQFGLLDRTAGALANQLREQLGMTIRLERWRAETGNEAAWRSVQRAHSLREEALEQAERTRRTSTAYRMLSEADSLLSNAERSDTSWVEPTLLRGFLEHDRVRVAEFSNLADVDTSEVLGWIRRGLLIADQLVLAHGSNAKAMELRGLLKIRQWFWSPEELASSVLNGAIADLLAGLKDDESMVGAWLGLYTAYGALGQFEEGARAMDRALVVDAWHQEVEASRVHQVFTALRQRDVEAARTHCAFGRLHYPKNPLFFSCGLDVLGWTGVTEADVAHAWDLTAEIEGLQGYGDLDNRWHYRRMLVASIAARAGLRDSAVSILQNAETDPNRMGSARHWLAQKANVFLLIGDTATSLQLLKEYLEANPQQRLFVSEHVWYQPLHDHPEFASMVDTSQAN